MKILDLIKLWFTNRCVETEIVDNWVSGVYEVRINYVICVYYNFYYRRISILINKSPINSSVYWRHVGLRSIKDKNFFKFIDDKFKEALYFKGKREENDTTRSSSST